MSEEILQSAGDVDSGESKAERADEEAEIDKEKYFFDESRGKWRRYLDYVIAVFFVFQPRRRLADWYRPDANI